MSESDYTLRKKRMRLSSSSVRDTTSRNLLMASKSQSNSSVRVVPAVSHIGNKFLTELRRHNASSSLSGKFDTKQSLAFPRVTMKNLRLRRVFSPSSVSSDWDLNAKGKNQINELDEESLCDLPNSDGFSLAHLSLMNGSLCTLSLSSPSSDELLHLILLVFFNQASVTRVGSKDLVGGLVAPRDDIEAVELSQTTPHGSEMFAGELSLVKNEAGSIDQEINGVNGKKIGTKLSSKVIRHREKIFKNPGSVSYRILLPYLMEAADGIRDADVKVPKNERGESMVAEDRLAETEPVSQSPNSVVKPHGNITPLKKMTSSSATKISLCSRPKLFKVPGSVNYRRMLSYLKETSEDNPGIPEAGKHTDPLKNIEENAPAATENKGASNEASDSSSCPNNFEAPLSDPENDSQLSVLSLLAQ